MEPRDRETLREMARHARGSADRAKALLADGVLTLLLESEPSSATRCRSAKLGPMEESASARESCQGCGRPFRATEAVYQTLDDVWLCRRCYEAVPPTHPHIRPRLVATGLPAPPDPQGGTA